MGEWRRRFAPTTFGLLPRGHSLTGGFRKLRVARKGMGKSGGARVIYIWRNEQFPVFLITVFPKNEKENL